MKHTIERSATEIIGQILGIFDTAASKIDAMIQSSYRNSDIKELSLASSALNSLSVARMSTTSLLHSEVSAPVTLVVKRGRPRVDGIKRGPGRPRKNLSVAVDVEPKRGPGRPRKNSTNKVTVLTAAERTRRKLIHQSTSAGELTGSKTYRPYLLRALHELDRGNGVDYVDVQVKMRSMMNSILRPADDENVGKTNRPRWMYQTSALRPYLVKTGVITQVGDKENGDALYSLTPRGLTEIGSTGKRSKDASSIAS